MTESNGQLSVADKQKLIDWLNTKSKNHACPVCESNDWAVADHLIHGLVYSGGGLVVGGPSYPIAIIACRTCAYTRQFMAMPIGLVGTSASKEEAGNGR